MAYRIQQDNPECDGYAVVSDEGEVDSCHPDEAAAQARLDELNAAGGDAEPEVEPEVTAARVTIEQLGEEWALSDGRRFPTYAAAVLALADEIAPVPLSPTDAGLLPEWWISDPMAFNQPTGDGRNMTECAWSFREPAVSTFPLMLQTSTDVGHFGAELAGFAVEVGLNAAGEPRAVGRFYDSERGREFRDMLLNDRTFGVSIDGGAAEVEPGECLEMDPEWGCLAQEMIFQSLEIMGLTGTPFPAFANARIRLATAEEIPEAAPVEDPVVAAGGPVRPPGAWFRRPEPQLGDPLLVPQVDDRTGEVIGHAVPFTVTDDGEVFGHVHFWGQCHVGYPGSCVTAPPSPSAYAEFNLGAVPTAEGDVVHAGMLVWHCDHAPLSLTDSARVRDHYANSGAAVAQIRVTVGEHGAWACGALLPGVTDEQLRQLRGSAMSGDWRPLSAGLDLLAIQVVNHPGFPLRRSSPIAASAAPARVRPRVRTGAAGEVLALVASNVVMRAPAAAPCGCSGKSKDTSSASALALIEGRLARMERTLASLDLRTRPMVASAMEALVASID